MLSADVNEMKNKGLKPQRFPSKVKKSKNMKLDYLDYEDFSLALRKQKILNFKNQLQPAS